MKIIYKYELNSTNCQIIPLPQDAKILSIQNQRRNNDEGLCLWAIVETDNPPELIEIIIEGTGDILFWDVDTFKYTFISTVQVQNDQFVWHIFLKRRKL